MPTANTSKDMRAVLYYGPQDIRLEKTAIPHPAKGEIVLKIEAALTCGTDFKAYRQGHSVLLARTPSPFGHEMAGTVAEVGQGVTHLKKGQRVVAVNSAPCDACFYCLHGEPELCDHLDLVNGAYAEYICLPARVVKYNVYPIPDSLSYAKAALAEPFACALHAVDKMALKSGDIVALLGLGNMGRLLICALKQHDVRILALGRNRERLALAKKAGAHETVDLTRETDAIAAIKARTEGRGADAVIEAVGKPETWQIALGMARKGGQVCLFGGCAAGSKAEIDTHRVHYHELRLFGVFHHRPVYVQQAVKLLSTGRIPTHLMMDETIRLNQVVRFFKANADANAQKAIVLP